MTTQYEQLKKLLTEFGVEFVEETSSKGFFLTGEDGFKINKKEPVKIISCTSGANKVIGYMHFFTEFQFKETGEFVQMGAWE